MINPDKRKAIYCLHEEGLGIREISRRLNVNRNTVRAIIDQKGAVPVSTRRDRIEIDRQLLVHLYVKCNGWIQRMHEILTEREGINIGYSTLTGLIRELNIGGSKKQRCEHVGDQPGVEMQHDTSPYNLKIGAIKMRIAASILYFRYCKMRYLKFYRSFNRFAMKCFFHEALTFFGFAACTCIIDNTNLARLRGSGQNAVIVPEMEHFARQYGFEFRCHEIGHANRKAGNERSFYTVETNFFPGRTFESLEDLNRQAFEWATVRMANRPVSKSGLIPAKAFEYEQPYLTRLAAYVQPPYLEHKRATDQYGYISFAGNYYWVPGTSRDDVKVLQYSDCLKIYHKRKLLADYPLPPDGVKNQQFSPKGESKPLYRPKYRKKPTALEEKRLRAAAKEIDDYLNFALKHEGKQKHRFIRQLHCLYQKIVLPIFIKTVQRALKYRITDVKTIERIALLQMREGNYKVPPVEIDQNLHSRQSYLDGLFSDEADLSVYDEMIEDEDG